MRKLLRHLAYLTIWIGIFAIAIAQMPGDALGCGGFAVDPVIILHPPTPFAYQLSYVVWPATPLVVCIALWIAVRLLYKKHPCGM